MNGLIFNGTHSSAFNLAIAKDGVRRPLLPETRDIYIDIPHKDGSILIPDKSKKDIIVEVDFILMSKTNLYVEARRVGAWLYTDDRAPLIFDDDPTFTYFGKVEGNIILDDIVKQLGKFTVKFRCLP